MRRGLAWMITASMVSISAAVVAQPAAPALPADSASSPPAPVLSPAPPPPASPVPAAQSAAADAFTCSLGDHLGIDPASASTAAHMVCAEVASRGPAPGAIYLVHLRRLGKTGVLVLEQRDAAGQVLGQRQAVLGAIEEVPVAAPRLADALLRGAPLEYTQRVDNLLGQETRDQKRKWGATYWGIGVGGSALPGATGLVTPALDLAVVHETERVAIGGDLRVSVGEGDDYTRQASHAAFSVGARYFTSDQDFTPFFGGGLSWSTIEIDDGDWHGGGSGFGFYAEGGVEALRMYKARLVVGIRATVPAYQIAPDEYLRYVPPSSDGTQPPAQPDPEKRYAVPIALTATLLF